MVLVLLGAGAIVVLMAVYYYKNPSYTDASGDVQPVGRGMVAMMGVLGLFLVAFGLFVQFHGLQ
jgi:formate hydrogenlyase subunit 3/multisubunit Na+/H+ antiporter MnhD subunit